MTRTSLQTTDCGVSIHPATCDEIPAIELDAHIHATKTLADSGFIKVFIHLNFTVTQKELNPHHKVFFLPHLLVPSSRFFFRLMLFFLKMTSRNIFCFYLRRYFFPVDCQVTWLGGLCVPEKTLC